MMKNKLYNVIQKLTNIGLSDADRADIRTTLSEHIDNNQPVRTPWAPILSPLQSVAKPAMVAALVFFMVGGISMAAENSLPGDPLYSVKVNVNEGLMALTSMSPTSEAAHESRLAARRIAELETLAARGNLNESISSDLTSAITEHTKLARKHISEASSLGAAADAASLETELNSTLETHSDILDDLAISNDGVRATTTASAAAKLRAVAQTKTEDDISTAVSATNKSQTQARNSQEETEGESQDKQLSPTQVKRLLERTADRLQSARKKFASQDNDMTDVAVRDSVEALLVTSAEMIDRAVDQIDKGNHSEADPLLRKALTYAHEAGIIINTRQQLEVSSGVDIESLLDNNASSSTSSDNATIDIKIKGSQDSQAASSSTSSTSSTSAKQGNIMLDDVSTSSLLEGSTTKELDTGTTGQNFSRQQGVSSDNNKRIDEVLERVKETLDSKSPQGLLPSRTSHGDNS